MQQYKTEAIILRRTNYGEADRILTLLTPEHGRVSAIAKGVRKPKSKLAGGLELFALCAITVAFGRGEMGTITSARVEEFYKDILTEYERTELAYVMIKNIYAATYSVSGAEFYHLLHTGLSFVNQLAIDWRLTEVWFSLHMQSLLGQALNTATDAVGEPLKPETRYHFDMAERAFYAAPGGRFAAGHIKFLRLASSKSPVVLAHVSGVDEVVEDVIQLLRSFEI